MDSQSSHPSPLLSLPIEIRTKILEFVLCESLEYHANFQEMSLEDLRIRHEEKRRDKPCTFTSWGDGRPSLTVLATSQQLYEEGTLILYTRNIFIVSVFLNSMGTEAYIGNCPLSEAFERYPQLRGIRSIHVKIYVMNRGLGWRLIHTPWTAMTIHDVPLLLAKHCNRFHSIQLTFHGNGIWTSRPDLRAKLYRFGLLRADHITFVGHEGTQDLKLSLVITSKQPLMDLSCPLLETIQFLNTVTKFMLHFKHRRLMTDVTPLSLENSQLLTEAVLEWDFEQFGQLAETYIKQAIRHLEQGLEMEAIISETQKYFAHQEIGHGRARLRHHQHILARYREKAANEANDIDNGMELCHTAMDGTESTIHWTKYCSMAPSQDDPLINSDIKRVLSMVARG